MVRTYNIFYILIYKCAFRYSGAQFFGIATSKSGPNLVGFVYFDLQMCFSLRRRTIFFHIGPDLVCFVYFDLEIWFSLQRRFNSHFPLNSHLRTRRFTEVTFQPTLKSFKNTIFRDIPNISHLWIFFLLTFAQLYLLSSDSTSLFCFFMF